MSSAQPASRRPEDRAPGLDGQPGLLAGLKEIYVGMSPRRRRQFYLVIALMLLGTVAELATIGAVIPFLAMLADPQGLGLPLAMFGLDLSGPGTGNERLLWATLIFSILAIVAGTVRLQLASSTQDFVFRLAHELSVEIQRRILNQPYIFHMSQNTSTMISAVAKTESVMFDLVRPLMQAASSAFIAAFIVAALIYFDPFAAALAAAATCVFYLAISALTRSRLKSNSTEIGVTWDAQVKTIQESLGDIRNVIIDNSQSMYLRYFEQINLRLTIARSNTAFIASSPRFVVETFGMVVIAIVAFIVAQRQGGIIDTLPVLGALALGAQRLLPLLQQVYNGWSLASGNQIVFGQVLALLRLPNSDEQDESVSPPPLPLLDKISIDGLCFTFPSRREPAVNQLSLEIPRGSTMAIIGETGSGKSTLVDLVLGLLKPDDGHIYIDGTLLTDKNRRSWQGSIAHVPQSIFLADLSIAQNIALADGLEAMNLPRAIKASRKARLHEFVSTLADGYDTIVGERGVRLSGGQRQRLGIARAIYKQSPILVLDEATSALDRDTEAAVMDSLHDLGKQGRTILIIAHRMTTIARCDLVARLHQGRVVEFGTFDEVVGGALKASPPAGPTPPSE